MKKTLRNSAVLRGSQLALLLASCLPFQIMAADAGASASHSTPAQSYNLGADKIALKGYDPVSYFAQSAPTRGKKEINTVYQSVTYYFASDDHKKAFAASPAKYLPAYGGWCATAMAKGEKVQVDPTNFKVTNGRLFLFYKGVLGNALNDWNKDEAALTEKADVHWKTIAGQ